MIRNFKDYFEILTKAANELIPLGVQGGEGRPGGLGERRGEERRCHVLQQDHSHTPAPRLLVHQAHTTPTETTGTLQYKCTRMK